MALQNDQDRGLSSGPALAEKNDGSGQLVEFDKFIEGQLRKTRSHVRSVDIAGSLMLLAAGSLGFFFLAAMFDHWIVAGGLGFWGRSLFLAVYLVAALTYLVLQVLPLMLRRINPVYAAHTIKRSRPSLKNGLVNFLFFRANPAGLSAVMYQAVEEQAATHLAKAHVDAAVDRSKLIRIGYVLVGLLALMAVYTVVSPKNLFKTVGRIAMPWAEINAPTRTSIAEIEPASTQAFRGQQITVSARILGLPADGKVILHYSTADGQIVDRPIELVLGGDGYKHVCLLPAGEASLQQDVDYHIEAGDAISPVFHVEVVAAPTIFVRGLEYKYPSYTGLLAQRVEQQGDIKAIEGTEVTLDALANQPIDSAHVDFDCDGTPDQRMVLDGQRAKATIRLTLKDDRKTPKHGSYQLVFKNDRGQQNPQPVRHQIEVTRDIPPEIDFGAPKKDEIDVPVNGTVEWEVVANDPDFALRMVKLSAIGGTKPLFDKLLLDEVRRGQFTAKYRFEPAKLGLKPGDVVEYSALAEDNKDPRPNRTETPKRRIRVVSPDARKHNDDQLARNEKSGDGQKSDKRGQRGGGDDNQPRDADAQPDERPAQPQQGDPAQPPNNAPLDNPAPDNGPQDNQEQQPDASGAQQRDDQKESEQESKDGKQGDAQQGNSQKGKGQQTDDQQGAGEKGAAQQGEKSDSSGKSGPQQQGDKSGKDDQSEADPGVSSDGSNDGDAIERILKHRDQKQSDGKQSTDDQTQKQPAGNEDREQSGQPQNRDPSGEQQESGKQPSGDEKQAGKKQPDQQPTEKNGDDPDAKSKREPRERRDSSAGQQEKGGQKGQGGQQGDRSKQGDEKSKPQGEKDNRAKSSGADDDGEGQPQSKRGKPGDKKSGDKKPGEGPAGAQEQRDPGADDHPTDKQDPQAGDETKQSGKEPGDPANDNDAPKKDPDANATRENSSPDQGKSGDDPGKGKGQGAQSKDDPKGSSAAKSKDAQRPDAKGRDGERDKGNSGAGQKSQDKQGSPSPQETSQPRDKTERESRSDEDSKDPNQAQSPSQSKRESDSEGQDDGDRSGGGKRGGGQKANKPGTGGAGKSTAADEGAGTSEEAGKGENSDRAGNDRASDKPTGQQGSQSGKGSGTKPSTGEDGQPGSEKSPDAKPNDPSDTVENPPPGSNTTPGDGAPTGGQPGGKPDDRRPQDQPWKPGQEVADEANLEYARKATDLALSHLKDELAKGDPDPELLDRLGWTRKDLENFIKRWEQMRSESQTPGEKGTTARRELDETLRSLGLRPRATSLRGNDERNDKVQGLKESRRTSPPPEYAEQTKAYTQGTARGGK